MGLIKCCVPFCIDKMSKRHRFPNPKKNMDNFNKWKLFFPIKIFKNFTNNEIYNNLRICALHFNASCYSSGYSKLNYDAFPTEFMPDVQETNEQRILNNIERKLSDIDPFPRFVTKVKLEMDPIEISNIMHIEADDNDENLDENCASDDIISQIPFQKHINKKFEDCKNFLTKLQAYLSVQESKKIETLVINLWGLVKNSFNQIDKQSAFKMKKLKLYRKNINTYQRKFGRVLPKYNECIKFIDFIKKNKKLFSTEIENYLIQHKLLRLNKVKINDEFIYYEKASKTENQNEIFDEEDVISECTNNMIDAEIDEQSQQRTIQVKSASDSKEDQENSKTNIFTELNENPDSEAESTESDTNDDELFKIVPEENRNKQNYTKLDTSRYQCNICQKISPNYSGFLQHTISHEEQTLLCYICGRVFGSHKQCLTHMGMCRNKTYIRKRKLKCEGGGMHSGIDFKLIASHERCPYKKCSKRFVHKNFKYYEHIDFHRGIKPYSCNTCSREFKFAYNLFAHLKNKSKCSLANCTLPEYAPKVKNYNEYIELATLHYEHECDTCGRKFETKFKLLEHQNSHTGEKQYLCQCGSGYNSYGNLFYHIRKSGCNIDLSTYPDYYKSTRINNNNYPIQSENKKKIPEIHSKSDSKNVRQKKKYICTECDNLDFGTYVRLKYHRQSKHMEKKIECEECHRKFSTLCLLKTHLRTVHIRAYKCDICKPDKLMTCRQYSLHKSYFHNKNNSGSYECKLCELQFQNNLELIEHVNEACHASARATPYLCLICNHKHKHLQFLKHLNESSHSELETTWRKKFDINKLTCFYCNEEINLLSEYLRHLDNKHHESNFEKNLNRLVDKTKALMIDMDAELFK